MNKIQDGHPSIMAYALNPSTRESERGDSVIKFEAHLGYITNPRLKEKREHC